MNSLNVLSIPVFLLAIAIQPIPTLSAEPSAVKQQEMIFKSVKLTELYGTYLQHGDNEGFWRQVQLISDAGHYPIVEEIEGQTDSYEALVRITFLYRQGLQRPDNVLLFANINHILAEELLFEEIGRTGVYFKSVEVPQGVRFHYRIIENDPLTGIFAGARIGTRLHLLAGEPDVLNPHKTVFPGRLQGRDYIETWVELPGASPQPYIVEKGNPRGELLSEERQSSLLGYHHKIFTYLPPAYDPKKEYPLMILFDAESYFSAGSLQLTLENLIAEGSIPPLIVLGINAGIKEGKTQRNIEFTANPLFMEFINDELLPWFTSVYNITPDPHQRVIAGSSFGGLFSTYFAFNHPQTVSNVLSQSGSFHWGRQQDEYPYEWLIREFAFAEKKPISIYMEVGKLEGEYAWEDPGFPHQIINNRHFKTILDMKRYDVTYHEYGGGHEMLSWRGGIAEGLKQLFQ